MKRCAAIGPIPNEGDLSRRRATVHAHAQAVAQAPRMRRGRRDDVTQRAG